MNKRLLLLLTFSIFSVAFATDGTNGTDGTDGPDYPIIVEDPVVDVQQVIKEVMSHRDRNYEASVRVGTGISGREMNFITKRLPKVRAGVEKFTGESLKGKHMPFVSMICSGGGYRAMISTAGFMEAAKEIGLLDSSMYLIGLSGSTWMMGSWLAHDISFKEHRKFLKKQVSKHLINYDFHINALAKKVIKKFYNGQPVTIADIWGHLIGNVLFEDIEKSENLRLSDFAKKIDSGNFPYPIFTTIIADASPYEWMELTPYEASSKFLKASVPIEAFGKKFSKGVTADTAPELSLDYILGLCGSAYALNFWDVLKRIKEKIVNLNRDQRFFISDVFNLLNARFSPGQVNSFNRKICATRLSFLKHYMLIDAGIDYCLPFPPTFRRLPDVIIACDASGDSVKENYSRTMTEAVEYAQRKGHKFPKVNFKGIGKRPVSVFYDKNDPEVPVVVYIPNKVDFNTIKLKYSGKDFDKLYDYMKQVVVDHKDDIANAIKIAIKNVQHKPARV